jgi:glycosyltransferase involved in cell wall biosynthesis
VKIALLGPYFPYKGGVAHYTGLLHRELSKKHEIVAVSYSVQYPHMLYRRPQKDYGNDALRVKETHFLLNTVNPLSWVSTARFINREKPDALLIEWWHPFFAPSYAVLLRLIAKSINVVVLCLNVLPHEGFPLGRTLSKIALQRGDCYIIHSERDEADLRSVVKQPRFCCTPPPTYNLFKMQNLTQVEARNLLGVSLEQEMILFFGFIREYKGLKHLLRAMPRIAEKRPAARLFAVGEFFENNKSEYLALMETLDCNPFVTLVDGYVPDHEVEKYFAACDMVVLPYESATQSGIAQIAYDFGKPVISTNVGGLPEVIIDGNTGYLVPPKDTRALAEAVIDFFAMEDKTAFRTAIAAEAYKYSWERMAETVDSLLLR